MRGLAAVVVALVLTGCGGDEPKTLPAVEDLIVVEGTTLVCSGATVACAPFGEPTSCTCAWSCVSWQGVDFQHAAVTFTRAAPTDPWPSSYSFASFRHGACD